MRRVDLFQEKLGETWVGVRVIAGAVLHVHQQDLR